MSGTVKGLIIFVAGAGAGCVGTYLALKKYFSDKAEEEIERVNDFWMDLNKSESEKKPAEEKPKKVETNKEIIEVKPEEPKIIDYGSFAKPAPVVIKTMTETGPSEGYIPGQRPYVIVPDEFYNAADNTKVDLSYYAGDNTLFDQQDNLLDIIDTVGADAIDQIGQYERDMVYVRNRAIGIDYAVTRYIGKGKEIVLGLIDEEQEK